jgi:hypothetical protein
LQYLPSAQLHSEGTAELLSGLSAKQLQKAIALTMHGAIIAVTALDQAEPGLEAIVAWMTAERPQWRFTEEGRAVG